MPSSSFPARRCYLDGSHPPELIKHRQGEAGHPALAASQLLDFWNSEKMGGEPGERNVLSRTPVPSSEIKSWVRGHKPQFAPWLAGVHTAVNHYQGATPLQKLTLLVLKWPVFWSRGPHCCHRWTETVLRRTPLPSGETAAEGTFPPEEGPEGFSPLPKYFIQDPCGR